MKDQIKAYIKSEINRLLLGEVKSVELEGVSPSILEEVLGKFEDINTNGWQVDYWTQTNEYKVSGSMYYGTATVSLENE